MYPYETLIIKVIIQLTHTCFLQVIKMESLLILFDYAAPLEITDYYYLKPFIILKYKMSIIKIFHLMYKDEKTHCRLLLLKI